MEYRYVVHRFKALISAILALFLLVLCLTLLYLGRFVSALVFGAFAVLYGIIAVRNGAVVVVNSEGVKLNVFNRPVRHYTWDKIQEIGVMGTRVFNKNAPEKTGTVFIYFSEEKMSEEQRFQMMLKWPPNDKIFFEFSLDKLANVQNYWNGEIVRTNIGNIQL